MISLFSFMISFAFAGGGYVGNGGDAIQCTHSSANRFEGYYALDYVATLPAASGDDGLVPVADWGASQIRLLSLLRAKAPSLAQSFEHFTSLMYNTSYAQDRVWEPTPFGLSPLNDQRLTSLLPPNCIDSAAPKVIQAVIRLYEGYAGTAPSHIIYKYDPDLLKKLPAIQASFLYVHEWLWDLSPNVERNRRVNRFLHSAHAADLSPTDFVAELQGMGLKIPDLADDAFSDNSCQGYPMTAEDLQTAYPSGSVLASWGQLKFSQRERTPECDVLQTDCNVNWRPVRFASPQLQSDKYFLSPGWSDNDRRRPISLYSPDAHDRNGQILLNNNGEIRCAFVTGFVDHNMDCYIEDNDLTSQLFGRRIDGDVPPIPAMLTQECFRMKISGGYNIEGVRSDGARFDTQVMQESVFSIRAKSTFIRPK